MAHWDELFWEMIGDELRKLKKLGVGGVIREFGNHVLRKIFRFKQNVEPLVTELKEEYTSVGSSVIGIVQQ